MNVKRRQLLRTGISALVGFELAHWGIRPVNSQPATVVATGELREGRLGAIPAQLSQQFFTKVLYPNRSIQARYDRFIAQGFKFGTDALVGMNIADVNNDAWVFATLIGKKERVESGLTEFAIISVLYVNKTLFDLGASSSTFNLKKSQLESINLYLPGAQKSIDLTFDRQLLLTGTQSELATKINAQIVQAYRQNIQSNSRGYLNAVYPELQTAGTSESKFATALALVEQQVAREEFLKPKQDRYSIDRLNLAVRSLGLNRTPQPSGAAGATQTLVTLPLSIQLASAANLIGNAKRLDSDPVIMPRQSEIPEPSYR